MATATQDDYTVTNVYTNVVSTIGAIASVATSIQNIGPSPVSVVGQASGSAPTTKTGKVLQPGEVWEVNAAQVWVKAFAASGKISVETV